MKRRPSRQPSARPSGLRIEILESRIVPSALNITTGGTATTLISAGDNGTTGGMTILVVNSGQALVFVSDLNSNGAYDSGELTGIAVGDGAALEIFDDVNGDIATNLDPDGTLSDGGGADDGTALLPNHIRRLIIHGSVGDILAGADINNTVIDGVAGELRTGTAAGGQTIDYNGAFPGTIGLMAFMPAPKADGGSVNNASFAGGLDGIFTGDGGDNADGGHITAILITTDAGGYTIVSGNGGGGTKAGNGGDFNSFTQLAGTGAVSITVGSGGNSTTKQGGDGGLFKDVSITNNGDVTVTGGRGGDGFKNGGAGTEFSDFFIDASAGVGNNIVMDAGGGGAVSDEVGAKGSGGDAGDFLRGTLLASGDVIMNASGGDGGTGTKRGGEGSSVEEIEVTATGDILLFGTDGGATPDMVNIDGSKGRGGAGGHVSGKLNFFADPSKLIAGGAVTITTGNGGSGGRSGGNGGGIFGFDIDAVGDVVMTTGNGADYDPSTGSDKGNGSIGGSINTAIIATDGDVILTTGHGGGGSFSGLPGGNIGFIQVTDAVNVTFTAGNGGGVSDAMGITPTNANTDIGGAGGSIVNNRIDNTAGGTISGNVTLIAGNGYGNALNIRRGGDGGSVLDTVIVADGNITVTSGTGGEADTVNENSTTGGRGGVIGSIFLTGSNITITAGTGGNGISGGSGGPIDDLTITSDAEVNILAGDGGDATTKGGGDGGDVEKINTTLAGAGFVRAIAAGDGGTSASGKGGDGGSISQVIVTGGGGSIGDFTAAYGLTGMGGLFAGSGFSAGDISDVIATAISNLVAGKAAIPFAAGSISNIAATTIGADLDSDTSFDFDDSPAGAGTSNGVYDLNGIDAPIDGLVLAEALGTITGATLFTFETGTGVTTGSVDPQ